MSNFYHYFTRKFLGQKNISKLVGVNLVVLAILFGSLPPSVKAYNNSALLDNLSSAQFTLRQTATSSSLQYPLKEFYLSQNFSWYHPGVDLGAPPQAPVYPLTEGIVESATETFWGFGRYVVISHGGGFQSLYAHLSKIDVKAGQKVGKETVIGKVGATGWATGEHLHLEIYDNGHSINPFELLPY